MERPPVWLMRQAGRILPQYRKIRASVDGFKALVTNPSLAAEVTIQPVDALGVDAAILFSDILVIPEAMGLDYQLIEKKGPKFPITIVNAEDVTRLKEGPDAAANLEYVYDAIKHTKNGLANRVPLIGFAGAPWTLLAYMVEGEGSKTFSKAKAFLFRETNLAHELLQKITNSIIAYLQAKIAAGVDALQLFDSWAGLLDESSYAEFALPYLHQICDAVRPTPLIVFAKGAWFALEKIGQLHSAAVGLDWQTDPKYARSLLGNQRVLQGNLDPSLLLAQSGYVKQRTEKMLRDFDRHHIANLGHGVYPNTQLEQVKAFIDTVKSHRYII